MTLFALIYSYVDDEASVTRVRPEHRSYLKALFDSGRVRLAGPLGEPGPARGLIIIEGTSVEEAEGVALNDPFVKSDVVTSYTIAAWSLSMGAEVLSVSD